MLTNQEKITTIDAEVRVSLKDMLSLQLEVNNEIDKRNEMEALYKKRFDAMKEFLNYLKFTPYFKEIMNEFNDESKTLIMFLDDDKNVRLREDASENKN